MPGRLRAAAVGLALAATGVGAAAAQEAPTPPAQQWSFSGAFGTYDRAQLQRGLQVYKEVCSTCHALRHLYYRDLAEIGYTEDQIKAFAAQFQVTDGPDDTGAMFQRPARPSDPFVRPFPNDQAARAALNGALPADLSLIVKSREGGPDYTFALVTGYRDPPPDFKMNPNMYYNEYFPGHQIAMPPPLATDGQVSFAGNAPATIPDMARDVVAFLSWAAEPNLEERHRMGAKVIFFLVILTGLFYGAKRKIWSRLH
jgi:ubiquinol-cytochrome c reductase cytochrome c1 subunit